MGAGVVLQKLRFSRRSLLLPALLVLAAGCEGSKPPLVFTPAVLGGQPPHAVVLAAEDRDLAVALAVQPRPGRLLLVATVLGQDGRGTEHLQVGFGVTTRDGRSTTAKGIACTPGCYEAIVPARAPPQTVSVDVEGPGSGGSPLLFRLPRAWPPPSGTALVRKTESAYRKLKTLVTHERLASSPVHFLETTYWAVAPHRLHLEIRGGIESIIIGATRWDRTRGQPWKRSPQSPFPSVAPFWTPQIADAHVLGSARIRGHDTAIVSFVTPQIPAFFTAWIDRRTARTIQLHMTAAAHFMVHRYGPFDARIRITPPT